MDAIRAGDDRAARAPSCERWRMNAGGGSRPRDGRGQPVVWLTCEEHSAPCLWPPR
jgi:hypothetical protein